MRIFFAFAVFMFAVVGWANSANLHPDQALYQGQVVYSDDGRYALIMQGDGNLVYYRTLDWSARWHSNTHAQGGYIAVMQRDGNFVVYNRQWVALWNSETSSRPSAYLAAQNDGNLVVYRNGQAIWQIGGDVPDPIQMGDVVGRAMENNMPYAFLGHIGFYDQKGIYEVLNDGKPNAVAYNTLANFKTRAYNGYWGAASPKIPDHFISSCFSDYCGNSSSQTVNARWAYVLRAFQVLAIGAEYTYFAQYTLAQPRSPGNSARQGVYRCDTYVLDILGTGNISDKNGVHLNFLALPENDPIRRWAKFRIGDLTSVITPLNVFNKLKAYTI